MQSVRVIIFHQVVPRDLCYVSENQGFRFVKNTHTQTHTHTHTPFSIASVTEGSNERNISEND